MLSVLLAASLAAAPPADPKPVLDPRARPMPTDKLGPFARLPDGGVLCVEDASAFVSRDDGKTWSAPVPVFPEGDGRFSKERAVLVTRAGTAVVAFMNLRGRSEGYWDAKAADFVPDVRLDVWAVRSTDGGKTWSAAVVQKGYSGAVRGLVQSANGNLVLVTQDVARGPARHVTTAYSSPDDGKTWSRAEYVDDKGGRHPALDLGGHGHHDGAIEPTVELLKDGRLWMLIRTGHGAFWEAFSHDHGVTWRDFRRTGISASAAPGLLKRLASGRLLLLWNRLYAEGKADGPRHGPPWHAAPASYHREELSAALSDDDGKTWSAPVVLARGGKWNAYPYAFEPSPGDLWVTTMQGGLRFAVAEKDVLAGPARAAAGPRPPELVLPFPGGFNTVVLPDGTWEMYRALAGKDGPRLARARSGDGGRTWSAPEPLRPLPGGGSPAVALLDRRGEVHLFLTRVRGGGRRPAVDRFIDVWHVRSSGGRKEFSDPRRVFEGYTGSVQAAVQLASGRIVFPFGEWLPGRRPAPPTGSHVVSAVYSDDGGATWHRSPAALTTPCHEGYNGSNYGACEPAVVERPDGKAWMLIRSQDGALYESTSADGAAWTPAARSRFVSSNSPAALARLPGGRLAVAWNNCQLPPRVDGQGVYGGRDALHLAVSADGGATWRGFREVYLDARRDASPPKTGDRGTAYPALRVTPDGRLAVVSGQGDGRRALALVDPAWLLEARREDDFRAGLAGWSTFSEFGPARGYWRDRAPGAALADHPDAPGRKALHVRRPAGRPADGAVWNFPAGRAGTLTLRVRPAPGGAGGTVALTDRFVNPTDDAGEAGAVFRRDLAGLELGRWHTLELAWDCAAAACRVRVDGSDAGTLKQLRAADPAGPSYLRLRSAAADADDAGFLVERVAAEVTP